jgi:CheY-like chemotaxis protein
MHLRKLNCTSHRAENGEVAIEMLRSAPAPNMYSLILMDLRMPVSLHVHNILCADIYVTSSRFFSLLLCQSGR